MRSRNENRSCTHCVARSCLIGALLACLPIILAGETPAIPGSLREAALVPRIEWPVQISGKRGVAATACEQLGPDQIVVREDGLTARVIDVDREHRPTVHALLLDTSWSMGRSDRFEQVKLVAEEYVRLIESGDDRILVATFDTDLLLRVPMLRLASEEARERVIQEIRRVPGDGGGTDLHGSLYQLSVFLRGVPERAVIVLVTDGLSYDFSRKIRPGLSYEPGAVNNVTVFPIGIDMLPQEKIDLGTLAREAGGFVYAPRRVSGVQKAFTDIQRRLRRDVFVTYEPPFGDPREHHNLETAGSEVREVKIVSTDPSCEAEAYKRKRVVAAGVREWILSGTDNETLSLTGRPGRNPRDLVIPGVDDIVWEPGWSGFGVPSSLRPILPVSELEERDVAVHVPAADATGSYEVLGPADMLARWLMAGVDPVHGNNADDSYFRSLNGQSYLELRMLLGARILEFSEPHRKFARAKMEAAIRKKLEREIRAEVTDATYTYLRRARDVAEPISSRAVSVDRIQAGVLLWAFRDEEVLPDRDTLQQVWTRERGRLFDTLFELRRDRPTPDDYRTLRSSVVAWLGDVSARDLIFELEKRAANAWLGSEDKAVVTVPANVLHEYWDSFSGWFPAPRLQRIFVPLWLAYDPGRDAFGFHRIFYPRDPAEIPSAPYGLRVIDLLLGESEQGAGRWRVASLDHRSISLAGLPRKLKSELKEAESLQRVSIELARNGDGQSAKIDGLYIERLDGTEEVLCVFGDNDFDAGLERCELKRKRSG